MKRKAMLKNKCEENKWKDRKDKIQREKCIKACVSKCI